jgi:membrane-associated protease RseP (regulator of RpoE activity)
MKARLSISLALLFILAASLAADPAGQRRTVIVRDGKVVTDSEEVINIGDLLIGNRAFLGVGLLDLTPALREHFGATKSAGVLVESVSEGSPAERAGLHVGDIILSIDGKDVDSSWDLRSVLKDKKEGDTVRVEYLRGRARQTAVATLAEREGASAGLLGRADLERSLGRTFVAPEWRARVESLSDCDALQTKLKDLESRMKELEKKLQK